MVVIIGLGVVIGILLLWFLAGSTKVPLSLVKKIVTPNVTTPIYVLAEDGETTIEVWQFLPDDDRWSKLYAITRPIDKPDEVTIPAEEIERMNEYTKTLSLPPYIPEGSLFKRNPRYFTLSPVINHLAIVEWYSVYITDNQQGFFGINYTGNLVLETGQSQMLFQSPARVLVEERYYLASLGKPLWSPNAQYYAVDYHVIHQDYTPLIININTGTVQQLESEANLLGSLAWSPDSTTVFLYLYRSGFDSPGGIIRLCEIASLNCWNIELDGVWIDTWEVDWSPQRNQIVFAGANEDINWSSTPPPFSLYVFDPETEVVHEVLDNFNRSLRIPRWSPDGKFIAVEYNLEDETDFPNAIMIVDPDAGQIITEIPIEGCFGEWQWEQSSQSILQLPCFKTETTNDLMIYDIFDRFRQQIELPVEIDMKNRLGFDTLSLP